MGLKPKWKEKDTPIPACWRWLAKEEQRNRGKRKREIKDSCHSLLGLKDWHLTSRSCLSHCNSLYSFWTNPVSVNAVSIELPRLLCFFFCSWINMRFQGDGRKDLHSLLRSFLFFLIGFYFEILQSLCIRWFMAWPEVSRNLG